MLCMNADLQEAACAVMPNVSATIYFTNKRTSSSFPEAPLLYYFRFSSSIFQSSILNIFRAEGSSVEMQPGMTNAAASDVT